MPYSTLSPSIHSRKKRWLASRRLVSGTAHDGLIGVPDWSDSPGPCSWSWRIDKDDPPVRPIHSQSTFAAAASRAILSPPPRTVIMYRDWSSANALLV